MDNESVLERSGEDAERAVEEVKNIMQEMRGTEPGELCATLMLHLERTAIGTVLAAALTGGFEIGVLFMERQQNRAANLDALLGDIDVEGV